MAGQIRWEFDWDWSAAEQELKRAVMLKPNSSLAHRTYGLFLAAVGQSGEGIGESQRALELDPLSLEVCQNLEWCLYLARRNDESIAQINNTLVLAPDNAFAYAVLALNYAQKRMYPEAVAACQRTLHVFPDQNLLGYCGGVYALAGKRQDALAVLNRLKNLPPGTPLDPYHVAVLYDGLGENDRTIEWLERGYQERSGYMCWVKSDLWSDRLRSDPRFLDLLRRMNFPP
jgi:tetratricopeptide (TPR) repeat protein